MPDLSLNAIHIHLILNHFPIVLSVIAPLILSYGLHRKNREIIHVSLLLFFLTGLVAIIVYLSGRGAIEQVSTIPGIDIHALILHEDIASKTFWLIFFLGMLSGIVLYRNEGKDIRYRTYWHYSILILSLITLIYVSVTGYYGGRIRHTEINSVSP